jgi:hypothetical protein
MINKCIKKEKNYIIAENLLLNKTCYNCMGDQFDKNYSCHNHKDLRGFKLVFSANPIFSLPSIPMFTDEMIEAAGIELRKQIDDGIEKQNGV